MVSHKPWRPELAAELFIRVIITYLAGMFLAGLVELIKSWPEDRRDFVEMILVTIFVQGSLLFWTYRFLKKNGLKVREAFCSGRRDWRAIGIGLAIGLVTAGALALLEGGIVYVADKVFHWQLGQETIVEKLSDPAISIASKIFLGVSAVVAAPIAEEALFRGVLYPTIKQAGYPRVAFWGTSVLFGLAHFSVSAFIPLTLFAMILVWLYEITDNLMAPVMAHCALNTANFIGILYAASVTAKH